MARLDRQAVLGAAAKLANYEGLKNVSLKNLADRLGIRSPSLFKHVKGLDDLHSALMLYGWKQLGERVIMSAVGKAGDDAGRAMCRAFYEYAKENPGIFEAMMWINQNSSIEVGQAVGQLSKLVAMVLASYNLNESELIHVSRIFRSFLQGFSSIAINGSFADPVSIDESFEFGVEMLLKGISASRKR